MGLTGADIGYDSVVKSKEFSDDFKIFLQLLNSAHPVIYWENYATLLILRYVLMADCIPPTCPTTYLPFIYFLNQNNER